MSIGEPIKLHLGNCSDHPQKNDPTINCWAIRDESNRRIGPDELLALVLTLQARVEELEKIARLAAASVKNPAWSGICDEDVELELALIKAKLI